MLSGPPSGAKILCAVVLLAAQGLILTNTQSHGYAAASLSFSSIAGRHHRSCLSPLPPQVPLPLTLPLSHRMHRHRIGCPATAVVSFQHQSPPAAASI